MVHHISPAFHEACRQVRDLWRDYQVITGSEERLLKSNMPLGLPWGTNEENRITQNQSIPHSRFKRLFYFLFHFFRPPPWYLLEISYIHSQPSQPNSLLKSSIRAAHDLIESCGDRFPGYSLLASNSKAAKSDLFVQPVADKRPRVPQQDGLIRT